MAQDSYRPKGLCSVIAARRMKDAVVCSTGRLCGLALLVCSFIFDATSPAQAQSQPKAEDFAGQVLEYARTDLQEWINDPIIIYAIKEQNDLFQSISPLQIKRMDKEWIEGGSRGEMVLEMLDRQASIITRDRRELSDGIINEIIVMDAHGLNVAISDRTSDMYQGDEAKYIETYLKGSDAVHVSELEFDESTQKIQTQVSLTVTDPENGEVIGAVTLGVSLDKLSN